MFLGAVQGNLREFHTQAEKLKTCRPPVVSYQLFFTLHAPHLESALCVTLQTAHFATTSTAAPLAAADMGTGAIGGRLPAVYKYQHTAIRKNRRYFVSPRHRQCSCSVIVMECMMSAAITVHT
jgi:hypothetical protein